MKMISVILLFVYSVSTLVGIGVFHCDCTHSQRMVVGAFRYTCPLCCNSDDSCCRHNHRQHDEQSEKSGEEHDCCSLVYQHVEVDQLSVVQYYDFQAKVLSLFFSPCLLIEGFATGIKECSAAIKNHSPPSGLLKIPVIYLHGQLRL